MPSKVGQTISLYFYIKESSIQEQNHITFNYYGIFFLFILRVFSIFSPLNLIYILLIFFNYNLSPGFLNFVV